MNPPASLAHVFAAHLPPPIAGDLGPPLAELCTTARDAWPAEFMVDDRHSSRSSPPACRSTSLRTRRSPEVLLDLSASASETKK